jgi:hypothetical protein
LLATRSLRIITVPLTSNPDLNPNQISFSFILFISGKEDLAASVLTSLLATRSLRIIIAICTTHSKYPQYWLQLLNHISSTVQNCTNILEEFKRLDKKDKDILSKNSNLKSFIDGSFQIAELSVWIFASCIETMCHEDLAKR